MQSVMSTAPPPSSPSVLTDALQQLNIAETRPPKFSSHKAKQRRSAPATPTQQHAQTGRRSSSRPSEARRQKSTDLRRGKRDSIEELFGVSESPSVTLIDPSQLGIMLKNSEASMPLLIDMRDYSSYERIRIRQSINVSLPSLLVKRYRRGTASNFNLESFISTVEGKQFYVDWQRRHKQSKRAAQIVVYDERDADEDSHVSIVLGALERAFCRQQRSPYRIQLYSLEGGFTAFKEWDTRSTYLTGTDPSVLKTACWGTWPNDGDEATKRPNHLRIVTPMQSRSASTLSSATSPMNNVDTNVQRRASLFTLDTSTSFARSRRRSTRSKLATNDKQQRHDSRNVSHGIQFNPPDLADIAETSPATSTMPAHPFEELHSAPPINKPSASPMTPQTDAEYEFVISEIVPGFLFLGPEISTPDQVSKLQSHSIKRILNMAEECDDDVPGLKQVIKYSKVAARDTVEMQNLEETLRKAVQIIVDAKKHHEPIYVHCKAGKSRSVAAILAYFVLVENWTLKRAYQHIIKARPTMSPNIGFVAELLKLEQSVHGKVSNFATLDWQTNPPSPGSQLALGKLQMAWKNNSSGNGSSSNSYRSNSNSNGNGS